MGPPPGMRRSPPPGRRAPLRGSITSEVTARRIPPTHGPPGPMGPGLHPADALRRGGSGPLGPEGLFGDLPGPPKKKRARGGRDGRAGRRIQEKRAKERERLERRPSGGPEGPTPPVKVTGGNKAPLGNGSGAEVAAAAANGGSPGEYVMVEPMTRSGSGGPPEHKSKSAAPASKGRLRSVVATAAAAEPAGADERAAKKSKVEPGTAAAAIAAATAAQRAGSQASPGAGVGGVSPGGRRVLNAAERERARQQEREREKSKAKPAAEQDKGAAAAKAAAAGSKQRGHEDEGKAKGAAGKEEKKAARDSEAEKGRDKAAQPDSSKKRSSASPSPGAAEAAGFDGIPERLRGRLSWSEAQGKQGGAAEAADDRWAPGSEEGEDAGAAWVSAQAPGKAAEGNSSAAAPAAARRQQQQQADAAGKAGQQGKAKTGDGQPSCFQEFAEVWYWREESREIGPKSIRKLRTLFRHLSEADKSEMMWKEMYTRGEPKECKLLKHLLNMGDPNALSPSR